MAATVRLAVALCLLGCNSTPVPQSRSAALSAPAARESAVALGYENDIVEFDLNTGRTLRHQALDKPTAPSSIVPGHYMVLSSDGQALYALIRRSDEAATVLALDRRTLAKRWSTALPAVAGQPRALAVGPRTGTVFALTNNDVGPGIQGFGPRAEAVVSELDSGHGTLQASMVLRRPDLMSRAPEDWFIIDGLVNADESRLYVSFHNQGLFDYDLTPSGPIPRCSGPTCLDAHGDVALWNGSILTATGSRQLHLISTEGVLRTTFDTQLDRNHLMTFAVDKVAQLVYAVGSCKYVPGMTSINLKTGKPRIIVPQSASSQPCGDRLEFARGRLLVGPAVMVIDPATGTILVNTQLSAIDEVA